MTSGRAAALLAIFTLGLLAVLLTLRAPLPLVWGDEGTYLAMADSLVQDGDLRFEARDRVRAEAASDGRATLILQQTAAGITYSKPILFPLAAMPFYALWGDAGPVVLNALLLAIALLFAYAYLRRLGAPGHAALVVVTFAGASVLVPYVFWRMADLMQATLVLAGLVLVFAAQRGAVSDLDKTAPNAPLARLLAWRGAPYLGAALLGLATTMRVSNGAFAAVPALAALLEGRLGRAVGRAVAALASFLLVLGLTFMLSGTLNPYRAVRTSFTPETGFPGATVEKEEKEEETAKQEEEAGERFITTPATHSTRLHPEPGLRRVLYAVLYFFVGRHTGLLFYFPAAVVFLVCAFDRPDRASWSVMIGFTVSIIFFLVWKPWNYFGGETFLGNRYLISIYPALLVALRRLPGKRLLALAWCLAALAYGSALASSLRTHDIARDSQSHTYAGIFRYLPYESTAQILSGRQDRYWAGHFVRFVDPFAVVRKWSFDLVAGRPPAELEVANWQAPGTIQLAVMTEAPHAALVFTDRGKEAVFAVGREEVAQPVTVALQPTPPWRHHRFWWDRDTLYNARTFRLALTTPDGSPARARIRYLGDPRSIAETFFYARLGHEIPKRVEAGSRSEVVVRVRNASRRIWEVEDVMPVVVRYRLFRSRQDGGEQPFFTSKPIPLPRPVRPLQEVALRFEVAWPKEPRGYRFEVDLVLTRIGAFATRLGAPLARTWVEVEAPAAAP